MNQRTRCFFSALALLLAASGCGQSRLVSATGRLTYQGQPVPSTLLTFLPDDQTRAAHGLTDDNGNFTVTYSRTQTGIPRGWHTVVLRYDVSVDEELHKIPPKASHELKAVIARYSDPATSGLRYEIAKSGQFLEIDLK
jgi:hypothetical protein